jgi:hypothetical protein
MALPFLSEYDPPGSSEGSLDPLGLYMLADQLAVELVPAVRERMQRIRFLTAIAVGSMVTEGVAENPQHGEVPPWQVWEWLVVEAIVRSGVGDQEGVWAVPGTSVTRNALSKLNCIDSRSYLKTPRVFGFHGVYKALAVHSGLVDDRFRLRDLNGQRLVEAWARDRKQRDFGYEHPLCCKWREAVERSLRCRPPHTKTYWTGTDWEELAEAFLPNSVQNWERRCLRDCLLNRSEKPLNALADVWQLLETAPDTDPGDERNVHFRLEEIAPQHAELLRTIRCYERFARLLTDAFEAIRHHASTSDGGGLDLALTGRDVLIERTAAEMLPAFVDAETALSAFHKDVMFALRFERFSKPLTAAELALELCRHHEEIQQQKSREGKRPWFDRIGGSRIQMRHSYRVAAPPEPSDGYVHAYRTQPIRRFLGDLS